MSEALLSEDREIMTPFRRFDTAMKHVLAIDQGTTGTTALIIAADGRIAGRGYQEITQHYPQPGWVEQDPEAVVDSLRQVAAAAVGHGPALVVAAAVGVRTGEGEDAGARDAQRNHAAARSGTMSR